MAINAKAKASRQSLLFEQKSDTHCLRSYQPTQKSHKESRDQNNFEAKKTPNYPITNKNCGNNEGQSSQSDQVLGWLAKKDSGLCHGVSQSQISNTLATGINVTTIKKDNKVKVDLSKTKCYNCHKKGYYANKCPNKETKN